MIQRVLGPVISAAAVRASGNALPARPILAAMAVALSIGGAPVLGNTAPPPPPPASSTPTPGAGSPVVAASEVGASEVQIELERFGAGNQARVGSWCGIRLKLTDTAPKQRELIVRLRSVDTDGDKPVYQTSLTSNPGLGQQVWLYARLPYPFLTAPTSLSVAVFEATETSDLGEPGAPGYRAGRMLASVPVTPRGGAIVEPTVGLYGVVGQRALGLQQYADRAGVASPWHKIANEVTDVVTGLTPEDLPDRWVGLAAFDAILWADGDPAKLRGDRARAVREYVMQGGHLVIVLPPVGQTWTNAASNELIDIMPSVSIVPQERIEFEPYRQLLTASAAGGFPKTSTVQFFERRPEAPPSEAISLLAGPDGKSVVVSRDVGAGAVTLIGLDLNQTALAQFKLIDAEIFWHRVLGRRGNLLEPEPDPSMSGGGKLNLSQSANRKAVDFDAGISAFIGKSGSSATGVLVGFIVFALYWAVAGPVGFAILKRKGLSHHSWPFFIGASLVFTVLAWGGAQILRPKRIEASHLTILDHVFGQPTQRARMWASVLIPSYGTASIGVGDPAAMRDSSASRRSMNTVASWESSESGIGGFGGFPDAREYAIDSRTPDVMRVPTRQTVKQVEAQWAGGPRWEMPLPLAAEGASGAGRLVLNEQAWQDQGASLVSGSLVHKLPGPLTDITVIVVRRQSTLVPLQRRVGTLPDQSSLICIAEAYRFSDPWEAGTALSLDTVTRSRTGPERPRTILASFLDSLMPSMSVTNLGEEDASFGQTFNALTALAVFPMLPTPNHNNVSFTTSIAAPQRSNTHGLDLGRWFTRPCVIVIGVLGQNAPMPSPVPLLVDGEAVPTGGVTLVRWVYPLPENPPKFQFRETDEAKANPAP